MQHSEGGQIWFGSKSQTPKMHIFVMEFSQMQKCKYFDGLKARNQFHQNRLVGGNEFCYQVERVDIDKVLLVHKSHHHFLQLCLNGQQKPEVNGNVKNLVVLWKGENWGVPRKGIS